MSDSWELVSRRVGLLVDTNLLVLRVIGDVNPRRIGSFKRLASYTLSDYRLLHWHMKHAAQSFTTPQVMSEVSNLTDLTGDELRAALHMLREHICASTEIATTSHDASAAPTYSRLGLTDAAILMTAGQQGFAVLTNDLDLYLALQERGIPSANFTHLRAALL